MSSNKSTFMEQIPKTRRTRVSLQAKTMLTRTKSSRKKVVVSKTSS